MENINIADILKDSPKGTKLYSLIFGDVYLDRVMPHSAIVVTTGKHKEEFLYDGRYRINGECVLFPSKENRDWNTFEISFNDGDIVATTDGKWIGITTGGKAGKFIPTYCVIKSDNTFKAYFDRKETWVFSRLATEEEKQKLFDAIKANGYKWNAETKTLEKLIEPKFKVGDRIRRKDGNEEYKIIKVDDDTYQYRISRYSSGSLGILVQDNYELVPNKFDINTLVPFESRVLVRTKHHHDNWTAGFFSHINSDSFAPFWTTADKNYQQCVPYEGNEHLLGTTNDCDDYYKTWE